MSLDLETMEQQLREKARLLLEAADRIAAVQKSEEEEPDEDASLQPIPVRVTKPAPQLTFAPAATAKAAARTKRTNKRQYWGPIEDRKEWLRSQLGDGRWHSYKTIAEASPYPVHVLQRTSQLLGVEKKLTRRGYRGGTSSEWRLDRAEL